MGKGCAAHAKKKTDGHQSLLFDEFFDSGLSDEVSPFLTCSSRKWAKNLRLRSSCFAAFLLFLSFLLTFVPNYRPMVDLLLVSVYFLAGIPSLIESIEDLLDLEVNIDVLMTLAAFSSVLIGSPMEGALLLVLFDLAGSIEHMVTGKTHGALHSLHKLAPTRAHVVDENGEAHERSVKDIHLGTTILVKAGEIVPLDGEIIAGSSFVSLVHLTGESKPVARGIGETIEAGGRTIEGALTIRVTSTSSDSTLARIITLITEAHEARPTLQRWFDDLSRRYALSIISLSLLFSLSFPFFLDIPFFGDEGSIYRSLAFLIAASPCALVIALPTAYLSSISSCAWRGILLKGGVTLDALAKCSVFAFDKTGTLTTGVLTLQGMDLLEGDIEELDALAVSRALEQGSTHPIAEALCQEAIKLKENPSPIRNFQVVPGSGVKGLVTIDDQEKEAFLGNRNFIEKQLGRSIGNDNGGTVAYLLIGDAIVRFDFTDELRPNISKTLSSLQLRHKMKLMMLTGDQEESAKKVAKELSIQDYRANLRPEDKLQAVSMLADSQGLAMVGDGINDAPSLARATIGISMGAFGSATAIEASDVVLLHDNIELLDWLVAKSRKTRRIVAQNLFLASTIIIATSIPALLGMVPLGLAVILHEGGTVLVGLNGLRLLSK